MDRPPIEAIKKNWRRSDTEDALCDYALEQEKRCLDLINENTKLRYMLRKANEKAVD